MDNDFERKIRAKLHEELETIPVSANAWSIVQSRIEKTPKLFSLRKNIKWLALAITIAMLLLTSAMALPQIYHRSTDVPKNNSQHGAGVTPNPTQANKPVGNPTPSPKLSPTPSASIPSESSGAIACEAGKNGGATAPGVSAAQIRVATTVTTTGLQSGTYGQAPDGIQTAIARVNSAGGICGRKIVLDTLNSGGSGSNGKRYIQNWIDSNNIFALVAEPDFEGISEAIKSGAIDRGQVPVVGTSLMTKLEHNDPWVWPVAASTVTNMHIIAQYAIAKGWASKSSDFGIVFDVQYKFGSEGAKALNSEIKRLTGDSNDIPGFRDPPSGCNSQYCGISSQQSGTGGYSTPIAQFNGSCKPCKVVVMLLEPVPMQTWMQGEQGNFSPWYEHLFGGEPLFDDATAASCNGCGGGGGKNLEPMIVWTGYRRVIQPFDSEDAVITYCQSLRSMYPSDDCHNIFTEAAYIGTLLFIDAAKKASPNLTRERLRDTLNSNTFDLGLIEPLRYGSSIPRSGNTSMAAFQESTNATTGKFLRWNYLNTGFVADQHPTEDLK